MGTATEQAESIFGVLVDMKAQSAPEEWLVEAMEEARKRGVRARLSEIMWRIQDEIVLRTSQGWYEWKKRHR